MLSRGSSVFKAMLSSTFKEGTQRQANGVTKILLPLDDAAAMSIICNLLHLQSDNVQNTLSMSELLRVAALVENYEVGRAIKLTAQCWIVSLQDSVDDADRQRLLVAAFKLQHAEGFRNVGQQIVLRNKAMLPITQLSDGNNEMPEVLGMVFGELPVNVSPSRVVLTT